MSINGNYGSSYGYGSYGSYGGYGGSSYINDPSSKDISFSNGYQSPSSASGTGGTEQKSGGIKGFFKGIANGAKNAIKSLATPKGLLMAAAGIAACIAFPVAAPLVLGGLAVATGGTQMYKAAKNGDAEGMGEGFFTAGTGVLGGVGSGAARAALTKKPPAPAAAAAEGGVAADAGAAAATATKPGFFARMWSGTKESGAGAWTNLKTSVKPVPAETTVPTLGQAALSSATKPGFFGQASAKIAQYPQLTKTGWSIPAIATQNGAGVTDQIA